MKYKSNAHWPKGCFDSQLNYTSDIHDTKEQAAAVCRGLERNGAGGERQFFPTSTWVSEVETGRTEGAEERSAE